MRSVSRRRFLRQAGACLALPFLPSLLPRALADDPVMARPPVRLLFIFAPNGKLMREWTPDAEGEKFVLQPVMESLSPYRDKLLVLSGLTLDGARAHGDGPGDHARAGAAFLTGAHPVKTGGDKLRNGQSVDQLAAAWLGRETRFPSLELGIERSRRGQCDSGYSCAYVSNISWRSAQQPMAKEVRPRLVFERLFGDEARRTPEERARRDFFRGSILDLSREQARGLQAELGRSDRAKLQEYLEAVRELEVRLQNPSQEVPAGLEVPGVAQSRAEHIQQMGSLLALAFQSDSTRVASLMLGNAGSNRSYPELGVPGGHHGMSHHGEEADKLKAIRRIDRFHVDQLAGLLDRFAAVEEGTGSLLDNLLIVYGSGIGEGSRHNHDNLPILLLGGGGGQLQGGRHLRYPKETPLCDLYLSLLGMAGVAAQQFGDSRGALPGLGG